MKTFISPGSWFRFDYPDEWFEFEDESDDFLFYNPDRWSGNFRISAFRGRGKGYGADCLREALHDGGRRVHVGAYDAVYSEERFREEGHEYVDSHWVVAHETTCVECSFTRAADASAAVGEQLVQSLCINAEGHWFPRTLIAPRLLEQMEVDEAYNTLEQLARKAVKGKFTELEPTLAVLQRLAESPAFQKMGQEGWQALGLTCCALLADDLEGYEWRTLVDGPCEQPLLVTPSGNTLDPYTLFAPGQKAETAKVLEAE